MEYSTVRVLRGWIVALDNDTLSAKIKTWNGIISFSIRRYIVLDSHGLDVLTDSLSTCFYDDYDVPIHRVRVGVTEQDNELVWAVKMRCDDPIYCLEGIRHEIKTGHILPDYLIKDEEIDWLSKFFFVHWPETVPYPTMSLGRSNRIECKWCDEDLKWEFHSSIDLTQRTIQGAGRIRNNPAVECDFFMHMENEEEMKKLYSMLDVLKEQ